MKKSHRSHHRRPVRQNVLQVRVMSPRIAWIGCLRMMLRFGKWACVLGILAGLGWGAWIGVQKALYQNPDFSLRVISLNPNPVMDELAVAAAAGIDLTSNPNLLAINSDEVERKLCSRPEIAAATVERHLPSTLAVTLKPRVPVAWLVSSGTRDIAATRQAGALLVDQDGIPYPCPASQIAAAKQLPIIELPVSPAHPLELGRPVSHPSFEPCCRLLKSAMAAAPEAMQWIDRVQPVNEWSLCLTTRQGTAATFGLSDHARQIDHLRAALEHAGQKGYLIDTINLIPKYNIPITVRAEAAAPRAIPVVQLNPPTPERNTGNRRSPARASSRN